MAESSSARITRLHAIVRGRRVSGIVPFEYRVRKQGQKLRSLGATSKSLAQRCERGQRRLGYQIVSLAQEAVLSGGNQHSKRDVLKSAVGNHDQSFAGEARRELRRNHEPSQLASPFNADFV